MPHHISIIIVLKSIQIVNIYSGNPTELKQTFLVIHFIVMKQLYGLICADISLHNRNPGIHIFLHPGLHLVFQIFIQHKVTLRLHIQAAANGKIHGKFYYIFRSHNLIKCFH